MSRFARWLFGSPVRRHTGPATQSWGRRARLQVERLEDRAQPAVIYSDTYTWQYPINPPTVMETATVTVTVDDDLPGYEGLEHWQYHVVNNSFGTHADPQIGLAAFSIPCYVPWEVDNVSSPAGWGVEVGPPLWNPYSIL